MSFLFQQHLVLTEMEKMNFEVHGHGVKDYEIMIFDRWGEIIYTSNDIMQTWNGQIRGKDSIVKLLDITLKQFS